MTRHIVIHPNADSLAAAVAARLIIRLIDLQADHRVPGIALTGGGVGIATLREIAASPARAAVDWARVDIYWGDERFIAADDDERNEKQAREALLDRVGVDPARVHPMAPSDGPLGDDPDAAADAYAAQIAARSTPLDVVLLGMGPEGHVASVFPDSPAILADEPVVAVRDCPKPPPTRISLTLPTIRSAAEVWLLVAGESKAAAVAAAVGGAAVGGAAEATIPATGAVGRDATWWLIDQAAASALPPHP